MQRAGSTRPDVLGEPAAPQVDPRQAEGALRVATGDAARSRSSMPSASAYCADPVGDLGGERAQHELAEHHVVHDPLAVLRSVRRSSTAGELVGPERLEAAVVDVDAGERAA